MSRGTELFAPSPGRSTSSSSVGGALFAGFVIAGGILTGLTSHLAPVIVGTVVFWIV
jgi:hypothetical protein